MKAAKTNADQKIRLMKRSLSCLVLGTLGLILPVIGPLFALGALADSWAARRLEKSYWNPARPHRLIGMNLAFLAVAIWGMVDILIAVNIVDSCFNR